MTESVQPPASGPQQGKWTEITPAQLARDRKADLVLLAKSSVNG